MLGAALKTAKAAIRAEVRHAAANAVKTFFKHLKDVRKERGR